MCYKNQTKPNQIVFTCALCVTHKMLVVNRCYMTVNLKRGFIRSSTGLVFFFVLLDNTHPSSLIKSDRGTG